MRRHFRIYTTIAVTYMSTWSTNKRIISCSYGLTSRDARERYKLRSNANASRQSKALKVARNQHVCRLDTPPRIHFCTCRGLRSIHTKVICLSRLQLGKLLISYRFKLWCCVNKSPIWWKSGDSFCSSVCALRILHDYWPCSYRIANSLDRFTLLTTTTRFWSLVLFIKSPFGRRL